MPKLIEVLFTPADFTEFSQQDISGSVCVVFDILRATTTMVTALANGATAILPVVDIQQALAERKVSPDVLLAGERNGLRILAAQTGGPDFDLGNSPREFTPERVGGRRIAITTTNGTRALHACAKAQKVHVGSFLNLEAVARDLERALPPRLVLVCSGTGHRAALEDVLAAGALCERLCAHYAEGELSDAAVIARETWRKWAADPAEGMGQARNGRRLLNLPDLAEDVRYCARRDCFDLVATMNGDGWITRK